MMRISEAEHQQALSEATGAAFNNTTIMPGGMGQYAGNVAEIAFERALCRLGIEHRRVAKESYSHDFEVHSARIDIKAKQRTVSAQSWYSAHVTQSQQAHSCHYYVFASVLVEQGVAQGVEFMGWVPKREFWKCCDVVAPGEQVDGLVERAGAGRLEYRHLQGMRSLVEGLELYCYRAAFGEAK